MLGLVLTRMPRSARDETYAGTLAALIAGSEDFVATKESAHDRTQVLARLESPEGAPCPDRQPSSPRDVQR